MNRLADYLYVLARYIDAIQADKVEKSENTQVSGDKKERPMAENQGTQPSEAVIPVSYTHLENNIITELDGKKREDFDFLDQFIADYAIRTDRAEASMAVPSLEIARKIVDINVSRKEILEIVYGITPAKMAEVINCLNVVEMMMGMQKMRARKIPGNQAHITNLKDDPVQIAADAAEGALRGFSERCV